MNKKINKNKPFAFFWNSPQYLFVLMGLVIIFLTIVIYLVGMKYIEEPAISAFIVIIINIVLIIIAFTILKGFEKTIEISKIKSDFINVVSHQLRSPVVNLTWIIDAFEEEENNKKQKEYINSLKKNIERIQELVEYLFISYKIQQKELISIEESVNIVSIVEETVSRFKFYAKNLNLDISVESDKNIPILYIDKPQIKLVIENLIDNAICYNKKKGKIDISINYREKKIYFKIKDSGFGIPDNDQKYIFQKFFRAKNAEGIKEKGSGLGLFIIKSIIEEKGGKIWFESNKEGTIFYFFLPV